MEGGGSGGPNLEPRVQRLETSVESLHGNMNQVKQTLSLVSQQISDGFKTLNQRQSAAEDKLDATRTRRPEWGLFISFGALLLAVGGATLWPVNQRMGQAESQLQIQQQIISDRGAIIGSIQSDRDHIFHELATQRSALLATMSNRFTKDDGYRLEDMINQLREFDRDAQLIHGQHEELSNRVHELSNKQP